MCGIWALLDNKNRNSTELYEYFQQLAARGPDYSTFQHYQAVDTDNNPLHVYTGFHRLSIVNSSVLGNQPFVIENDERMIVFLCNGEIYNWKEIATEYHFTTDNDCMVIPMLYMRDPSKFDSYISRLKGEFAFVLIEFTSTKHGLTLSKVIAARDEVGVRPLYYSADELFFTSEIKGSVIPHYDATSTKGSLHNTVITEFPPGRMITFAHNTVVEYDFRTIYDVIPRNSTEDEYLRRVRSSVQLAVQRRLPASKPFAYLLSGGIDSSLVAALGAHHNHVPIKTFCCSIKEGTYRIGAYPEFTTGSGTDLLYAREVAHHIRSDHTEVLFTPQEGLDAITDVIRTIESWDTTTVRASVGQYMVCKYIREHTDCKVVMVGEGPDEVCSSYLFNWYAPHGNALEECAKEYVNKIHCYDVKRADRCISRWGLEGRVPLLDPDFIKAYWEIPADLRHPKAKGIEKWWLRAAFSSEMENRGEPLPIGLFLPESVRMRKKEAFSDGVSNTKSWYQMIQEFVEDKVSAEELSDAATTFPYCTPTTKEAYYYRQIFERFFPGRAEIIPGFWQPKWSTDGTVVESYVDPSARTLGVYQA